ncbi:ubiquitin elongating factor core-domain-containing protein [Halteromyces radiatus]|uniref:ubiquitin elongating factor core-domain-containing protein n=1 Tax=Halteromyces radiatus TaxID=101107 RepID=UPI00221FEB7E|nr:ubiquitin elongating factor core-domain-containing protein [Halteromyces radiatus]KAI8081622.1 ubiquitin elongating factor core-domain-containing protein [Halteromyces radiatus]
MSAELSEAEKIRLKRAAKLEQQAEEQKKRQEEQQRSTGQDQQQQQQARKLKPLPILDETNPTPAVKPKFRSTVTSSTSPQNTSTVTTSTSPAETKNRITSTPTVQAPAKSFEEWQNDAYSRILQVTLDPNAVYKRGICVYLYSLVQELEEENESKPYLLKMDLLDRVLIARMSLDPNEPHAELPADVQASLKIRPFDYLLKCWKQAQDIRRNTLIRSKNLEQSVLNQRINALDLVKNLLISYSGLIIQIPDMFPQSDSILEQGPAQLVPKLLADPDSSDGLPRSYIADLVSRFADEGLDTILGPALSMISAQVRQFSIISNFTPHLQSLLILCENKTVAASLTTFPDFDPQNALASNIEQLSLLGPFFSLSAYPDSAPDVGEKYFQHSEDRNQADLNSAMNGLRGTMRNLERSLFTLSNSIVRSGTEPRELLLNYFGHILKLNEKRAQMQVDPRTVASGGFMRNVCTTLLAFCEPFLDIRASKIDKIDTTYFRTSNRIDVKKDTKINADELQSDAYYNAVQPTTNHNFITEIFYLTLTFLHCGPIRSFVNFNHFIREYGELKKQCDKAQEDAAQSANSPQGVIQDYVAKQLKKNFEKMTQQKLAYETMLLDPEFLSQVMQFYNLVMAWLIRMVDQKHRHPWDTVQLPLPHDIPENFSMLPEWIIEDIVEYFIFLGKYGYETQVIKSHPQEELVTFIITFLRNMKYIKNPYLKAKFVEILFFFTHPLGNGIPGELEAMLNSNPLALKHLVPSLMAFYVDVEQTGASSQFYDKFNIRYNISHVMKRIWNHPMHREQLREESKNQELFTRFINMLMSDITYLMDESVSKLIEIHQIQTDMEDIASWQAQPMETRQEREANLQSLERQAQSYIALGNETIHMLGYMSGEVVEPFMVNEIVDRLAAMLDYNLSQLVGPKCTELKVKNPQKYHFQPRKLLSEFIDIYLNLNTPTFVQAVARDERSFRKEYFSKAASILLKYRLKSNDDIMALEQFVNQVAKAVQSGADEEDELGEAPDEFLDPIFFSLMEDPVLLPTSGIIVDRSTIRAHLLSDSRDPFNRAPLQMDMIQPATELRDRILAWKTQQKQSKMDTSL